MSGETDLKILLKTLSPELMSGTYIFCSVVDPPTAVSWADVVVQEREGTTLVALEQEATTRGLEGTFRCRKITLRVHSSLEAVGMMAAVSAALTDAGISTNPVAGFYHDHLYVATDKADEAMAVIHRLVAQASSA